jgi:hypothetical protein
MLQFGEKMPTAERKEEKPRKPAGNWLAAVVLAWLVPGGGHFLMKRRGRGALLLLAVAGMFLCGLMMRGGLFAPRFGDLLTTVIYVGGFIGNISSGILYLLTVWFGYTQPDIPGAAHDYGTKFLVSAGLLNILAMVDAYEIAVGKKE